MNEIQQPSVTEGLNVDQETRPSERRTRTVLLILASLLVLLGLARFFLVGNREAEPATSYQQAEQPSAASPASPASAPKQGKDFGL